MWWTYVLENFHGVEIVGSSMKKNCKKTTQKEFRIEKVTQKKADTLHVK